jgi:hypothetical protein
VTRNQEFGIYFWKTSYAGILFSMALYPFLITFYFIHCPVLAFGTLARLIFNEPMFDSGMIGLIVTRNVHVMNINRDSMSYY